jgi:hypothetical protein
MKNNYDEAAASTDAFRAFVKQFGPMDDPYNRVVLEVLLEELLGVKVKEEKNGNAN